MKSLALALLRRVSPIAHARLLGVKVGRGSRLIGVSFSSEPYLVELGDHVSATRTRFETHDGGVWTLRQDFPQLDVVNRIVVGNNVFLGYGCIVLPGVHIGNNVVVGAGSVVTRDIPDNSVAAGVPARVLGSLSDYREKSLQRGHMTKHLSPRQTRKFYEGL